MRQVCQEVPVIKPHDCEANTSATDNSKDLYNKSVIYKSSEVNYVDDRDVTCMGVMI